MEYDFINYCSLPSLESIARVNVVTAIYKQADIRNAMLEHSCKFHPHDIFGIESSRSSSQLDKIVINNISLLPLPPLLKAEIVNIMTPIKLQILDWIRVRKDTEYVDSICWTVEGTIDTKSTLNKLIDKDSGDHNDSYFQMACKHCLEDCVRKAWNKLPEKIKKKYLVSRYIYKNEVHHMLAYWIKFIKNDLSDLLNQLKPYDDHNTYDYNHSISRNMFVLSLKYGNIMAVKYFWKNLTAEEISPNIEEWVNNTLKRIGFFEIYQMKHTYFDVFCFLISQMTDGEQQRQVFQKHSEIILKSLFCYWPRQRFLIPTLELMWDYLDSESYVSLLSLVAREIRENKTTEKIFRKIWDVSPFNFRRCYLQDIHDIENVNSGFSDSDDYYLFSDSDVEL